MAMRLVFLGTRGEIPWRSRAHARHSVLLVGYRRGRVLIDCGRDWRDRAREARPDAIVLTHAHPDHADGLRAGAGVPVYATAETWRALARHPIERPERVAPRRPFAVAGITLEAFPVEHSLRTPAVAYRISAGRVTILYAPDVLAIPSRAAAMRDLALYVGDGASLVRAIARGREGARTGHASVREQLDWCAAEGVERAIFSHCGSEVVRDERRARERVAALGRERGIEAAIARDGLRLALRGAGPPPRPGGSRRRSVRPPADEPGW